MIAHADAVGELNLALYPQDKSINERIYSGVASAPGIAIGNVLVMNTKNLSLMYDWRS